MSLRSAVTALANVSVTGVDNSYDLDTLPGALSTAQLPALLPFLGGLTDGGMLTNAAFEGEGCEVTYRVRQVLFVEAVGQGRGLRDVLPTMATLITYTTTSTTSTSRRWRRTCS